MNRSKWIAIACVSALAAGAGAAKADLIAGWDFSQYSTRGVLTTDGVDRIDTLGANYSNLDDSLNLGPDSGAFGVAHFDGSLGSDDVDEAAASPVLYPTGADPWDRTQLRDGPILSNRNAPVRGFGDNRFDSLAALQSQGQSAANRFALRAAQPVQVVFAGDAGSAISGWGLAFGARAFRGDASISVEYDLTCTDDYETHANSPANLTEDDALYQFALPTDSSSTVCVRLGLTPGTGQPVIDNVALVPEPTSLGLQAASVLAIGLLAARRRRARG